MYWEDLAVTIMTIDKRNNQSEIDLITSWNGTKVLVYWGDFVLVKSNDYFR